MFKKFVLVILGVALKLSALKPPKEFALCHRADNEFQKCLVQAIGSTLKAVASGNKKLEIPDLKHLRVPSINIDRNGGPVDLSQEFTDCDISGSVVVPVTYAEALFEKENCYIRYKSFLEKAEMTAKYAIKGKLMMLDINGHGDSNITLVNTVVWHNYTCSVYEKSGNEYLNMTNLVQRYAVEKVYLDFDNLVEGNPELSAQILQVVNDNAIEVFRSIQANIEYAYAAIYIQTANNVFSKIPWKDIFPE